ncbi:EamA family transporter [Streptomyces sp. bgisy100]|uniref:EamA family transporter n=1 Tax=Streptomyces sp. bgisy100 TaxID=3413783 RepID=UPI003D755941
MRPQHIALAVLVAAVWGVNFVVIEIGLGHFPPLLFSALRFLAAALPAVFFVRRPKTGWKWIIAVGLVLGVAKFGLLFTGMHLGMPAGLSSLVLQIQAVFTAVVAAVVLGERPGRVRVAGMCVALAGITVAGIDEGTSGPLLAFALLIAAAAFWGVSNVLTRMAAPENAMGFMVWTSVVPILPLLGLSLLVEGPRADLDALRSLDWSGGATVVYVAWVTTLFGFGAWSFLLRSYPASSVAPFSLLVPVFGMSAAALVLGEEIGPLRWCAAVLLVTGVAVTSLGGPASGRGRIRRTGRAARTDGPGPLPAAPEAPVPAGTSASRTPTTASRPSPRG